MKTIQRERGATMLVVLMILLAITIVGIAAMRYSIIEQRAAVNIQQENLAFNTADSSISALINAIDRSDAGIALPLNVDTTVEFCVDGNASMYEKGSDTCTTLAANAQSGTVAVKALGCITCPGMSLGNNAPISCQGWKATGTGIVGDVTVNVEHWMSKLSPACQ